MLQEALNDFTKPRKWTQITIKNVIGQQYVQIVLLFGCCEITLASQSVARFSKAPVTFQARKATFSSHVTKNGEVYTREISCMKGTSVHVNKTVL